MFMPICESSVTFGTSFRDCDSLDLWCLCSFN
uniref:Uncharacterized protein n=1 Tax=Rhizophora mucronata TaxID=61149 RepID=A0A2P2QEX9_RHIMU